ncbi:peptidylprolyl isomerase [Streptosporangium sp. KLBMP 9127]|nr:peptidylprolyl isomerase [Streptosporangium sp. KLBMP 9127]
MSGEDRQSELAQEHKERQARRAAEERQAAKSKRNIALGAGVGVVVVVGGIIAATTLLGGADKSTDAAATPSAAPSTTAEATPTALPSSKLKPAAGRCDYRDDTSASPAKDVGRPPAKPSLRWKTMTLATSQGDIVIDLATKAAPCTVNSFAFLAKKNFYDGTKCHRLAVPDNSGLAMLQCGDPQAKADGKNVTDGQGSSGYVFDDENLGGMSYRRGTVFMAQAPEASNQNGSQFALSFGDDNTQLDQEAAFTPFGTISKGMEVLDKVAEGGAIINKADATGDGGSHAPKIPVIIKDVRLSTK